MDAIAELRDKLETLANVRDSNPPDAFAGASELDYARFVLGNARSLARAALSSLPAIEEALAQTRLARDVEAMAAHASDELNKHLRENFAACERYALRITGHELDRQNAQAIVRIVRAALAASTPSAPHPDSEGG